MTPARVDPERPPGWFRRAFSKVGSTRTARWFSRRVLWKLDPVLLRFTGGRVASTLLVRSALLETTGARTGQARRNAVIYVPDGEGFVIAASQAGAPTNPGWYHNLRAHPDVVFAGTPVRATVVDDEAERDRLWALADNVFPSFADYRDEAARAGRTIPLVRLTPR